MAALFGINIDFDEQHFPVNKFGIAQVHELDAILADKNQQIDRVLLLVADDDELVARLLNRAAEQGRTDDNEEVIRHRLKVYEEETAPLVAKYRERGIVKEVDGLGEIADVTERILKALS